MTLKLQIESPIPFEKDRVLAYKVYNYGTYLNNHTKSYGLKAIACGHLQHGTIFTHGRFEVEKPSVIKVLDKDIKHSQGGNIFPFPYDFSGFGKSEINVSLAGFHNFKNYEDAELYRQKTLNTRVRQYSKIVIPVYLLKSDLITTGMTRIYGDFPIYVTSAIDIPFTTFKEFDMKMRYRKFSRTNTLSNQNFSYLTSRKKLS